MTIREAIKNKRLFFDGGMGTELYKRNVQGDTSLANITSPKAVEEIHREYIQAGADIITANTFGAYKFKHENSLELIKAALNLASEARNPLPGETQNRDIFIAMDLGPTGLMLEPYGDVSIEECREIFSGTVKAGAEHGADFILIETMLDINELEAAVEAANETGLPIMATMSFNENGRTVYGASLADMVKTLESLDVDALGLNCGFGPRAYTGLVRELLATTKLPVILQPNAGLPEMIDGKPHYDLNPEEFAVLMYEMADAGVRLLGGCCGTSPAHIASMVRACSNGGK